MSLGAFQCFATLNKKAHDHLVAAQIFPQTRNVPAGLLLQSTYDGVQYPFAATAMMNPRRESSEEDGAADNLILLYGVEFAVLVLVNSAAESYGDAATIAWNQVGAVMKAFAEPVFIPDGFDELVTAYPCVPGDPQNVLTDSGKAGIYLPLHFKLTWCVTG